MKTITTDLLYMFGSGVVFIIVLVLIEFNVLSKIYSSFIRKFRRALPVVQFSTLDDDVSEEKQKVEAMTTDDLQVNNLVLNNLTKFYGTFLAVKQLSVAVKRCELRFAFNNY